MSSFECYTFEIFLHSFLSSFSLKCRWWSVYICRRLSRTWIPRTTARCGRKQLPASGGETDAGILTESGAARRFHQHSLPSQWMSLDVTGCHWMSVASCYRWCSPGAGHPTTVDNGLIMMMAVVPWSHPGRHTSGQYYNAGAVATRLLQFLHRYCGTVVEYVIFREIVTPTSTSTFTTISGKKLL